MAKQEYLTLISQFIDVRLFLEACGPFTSEVQLNIVRATKVQNNSSIKNKILLAN